MNDENDSDFLFLLMFVSKNITKKYCNIDTAVFYKLIIDIRVKRLDTVP